MTKPNIFDETIRALFDAKIFARGLEYYRSGAVLGLIRRGATLSADVHGSDFEPYRVEIGLYDGGVANARCSCPYDFGDYCKHIAAVLLKFAKEPAAAVERQPIDALLRELSRDTLAGLLLKRLASDPSLASWIEAELAASPKAKAQTGELRPAVDPAPIREQARLLLVSRYRRRSYWDGYGSSGDSEELRRLVEKAVPFLEAGEGGNALRVLEPIAESFVESWLEYYFDDEHMYLIFGDLGRLMAEAALMSELALEERDDLAGSLRAWQERLDDYGIDDGFHVAIRALESGWDELGLKAVMEARARFGRCQVRKMQRIMTSPLSGCAFLRLADGIRNI